jgi:hypothetical protein
MTFKRLPIDPTRIANAAWGHEHVTIYVAKDHVNVDLSEGDSHEFRPGLGDHAMIAVNRMADDVHEVFSYRDLTVSEKRVIENICAEFGGKVRYVNLDKRLFFSSKRKVDAQRLPTGKLLPIRICSPDKSAIAHGFLWEIYRTLMLQAYFKKTNFKGAIMSRKYGICLPDVMHDNYGDDEQLSDRELLGLLRRQRPSFAGTTLLYWNHRPVQHDKWVAMLRIAGYAVEEYRTLDQVAARMASEGGSP